jgi:hypothetical protein
VVTQRGFRFRMDCGEMKVGASCSTWEEALRIGLYRPEHAGFRNCSLDTWFK